MLCNELYSLPFRQPPGPRTELHESICTVAGAFSLYLNLNRALSCFPCSLFYAPEMSITLSSA